jgi:hypothetical protein
VGLADGERTHGVTGVDRGRVEGDAQEQAVEASARAGFAARAVLYAVVGLLAVQLAVGDATEDASQQGAMAAVAEQPLGAVMLGALAFGLAGYALYRAVQAVKGRGGGGVLKRRGVPAIRALVNGLLAFLAFQELLGVGEDRTESGVTAAVLDAPGGPLFVGGLGLVVAAVGVYQLTKAWTGDVHELADPSSLPPRARRTAHLIGRLGHLGRAAVFGVVGGFLVRAAVTHDPESGVGLDAALSEVVDAPFGTALLLGVAVCLVLFGVHCAVEAWYGRTDEGR